MDRVLTKHITLSKSMKSNDNDCQWYLHIHGSIINSFCAAEFNLYTEAIHQHEELCEAMGASGRQQRRHKNIDINQVAPGLYRG